MTEPIQSREITLTRTYDIDREQMFSLWTDPEHLARWWGPDGFTVPHAESDPRPGGALVIEMAGQGFEQTMQARYVEVEPPERLVVAATVPGPDGTPFLESSHTVTFADLGGSTEVTVTARASVFTDAGLSALAGMRAGWRQSLQCLDDVVTGADERQIVLQCQLQAPPEVVFPMWLRQDDLERWWGPEGGTLTVDELDPRPGGGWRCTMHGPDGVDHLSQVRFVEIVPGERLVYVHGASGDPDPSFAGVVTFDEMAGSTVLSLRLLFDSHDDRELAVTKHHAEEGGATALERLGTLVAGTGG